MYNEFLGGNSMIKVVSKSYLKKGTSKQFIELAKELVDLSRREQGCISYELFQDEKNEEILTFVETWESKEALEAHFNTVHFKTIVPMQAELREDKELNIYTQVL